MTSSPHIYWLSVKYSLFSPFRIFRPLFQVKAKIISVQRMLKRDSIKFYFHFNTQQHIESNWSRNIHFPSNGQIQQFIPISKQHIQTQWNSKFMNKWTELTYVYSVQWERYTL